MKEKSISIDDSKRETHWWKRGERERKSGEVKKKEGEEDEN